MAAALLLRAAGAAALVAAASAQGQPSWPATWDMAKSTIMMPCNDSGFLSPTISAQWGVVDFDWSNGKGAWTKQHPMGAPLRCLGPSAPPPLLPQHACLPGLTQTRRCDRRRLRGAAGCPGRPRQISQQGRQGLGM